MTLRAMAYGLLIFYTYSMLQAATLHAASTGKPIRYSKTFLQTADQLKLAGDGMMPKTKPLLNQTSPASSYELPSKKKEHKHSRFFPLGSKKKKADASGSDAPKMLQHKSAPIILYKKPDIPHEHISDTYINALTFYTACYKSSSAFTAMYIRMQMTHILEQLTQLYTPMDLFDPTTLFEPGYKDLIMQSKNSIQEPFSHSLIIDDVIKTHADTKKILQTDPSSSAVDSLCTKLQTCMKTLMHIHASNRTNAYQQTIMHAYAEETWRLIKQIPECERKTDVIQELFQQWHILHSRQPDLQLLLTELKTQTGERRTLLKNPLTQQNPVFLNECMKHLSQVLDNLSCLHQTHTNNKCQQYWISKAADDVIRLVRETSTATQNQHFIKSSRRWQKHRVDPAAMLLHISTKTCTNTKLHSEQTTASRFEMLAVLIDIYAQQSVSPAKLSSITDPLKIITDPLKIIMRSPLKTGDKKSAHFSPREQHLMELADEIMRSQLDYALSYYMPRFIKLMEEIKGVADKTYLNYLHDPLIPERMYHNLLREYELGVPFSQEELCQLEDFARWLKMQLPQKIHTYLKFIRISAEKAKERAQLKPFVQQLYAQLLCEEASSQASSSSH